MSEASLRSKTERGMAQVTIRDVAERAGVSYQTVSRVINNKGEVAAGTRQRVLEIIEELGYHPSAIARSLAHQRTRTLGLITADFSDYFFTQVIAGAEREARERDFLFLLSSTERNPQDELVYLRLLAERRVEGILFARPSTEPDERHVSELLRLGIPVVTSAYHLEDVGLSVVDVDNVDGGLKATRHLVGAGRRRVATITGPPSWRSVADRSRGYRQALQEAGLEADEALVDQGDWSYDSGFQATRRLLELGRPFDALFAQNDRMAIGAMAALHRAGRRIPEDVAVVGYDDIPVAQFVEPPLTTVRQPMQEVGRVATRLLIEHVDSPDTPPREILLGTELVVRRSSGSPGPEG